MLSKTDVLSEISQSIEKLYDSMKQVSMYRDILNEIQYSQEARSQDGLCTTFATDFGIGSLSVKVCHVRLTVSDPLSVLFVDQHDRQLGYTVNSHLHVEDLKAIIGRCSVISFGDWANFNQASDLWDRLRTDVIKPLGRRDFEFIFYIGDIANKLAFEVDEIMDIMSDFSFSGKVTLVLQNGEISELWELLTGQSGNTFLPLASDDDYKGRYIFDAMKVHRLLVYSPDHRVTIFSRDGRQEWEGRGLYVPNVNGIGRDHFNRGYILGLLLQLRTIHCTALGLALSGAYLRNEVIPDLRSLHAYIRDWINEMDQPLIEH